MLDSPLNLPDEPDELKQLVGTLASEVKSQALLIEKLKHQLAGMRRHRFGASSESLDQLQLTLEIDQPSRSTSNGVSPNPHASLASLASLLFDKSTKKHHTHLH